MDIQNAPAIILATKIGKVDTMVNILDYIKDEVTKANAQLGEVPSQLTKGSPYQLVVLTRLKALKDVGDYVIALGKEFDLEKEKDLPNE